MHELSIVQSIVEIVEKNLPAGERQGVKSVKIKVGRLAGIVPESLRFCFEAFTEGTAVQGAWLEIENGAGDELDVVEIELAE